MALGALSVTYTDCEDEPILEPGVGETPLWPRVRVTGLFDSDVDEKTMVEAVSQGAGTIALGPVTGIRVEDRNWQEDALADLEPMRFGQRLWVVPCSMEAPERAERVVRLDPGLAFGSGTHATTALCLEWLDRQRLDGRTVLDFGCGSGILAIAALVLGAAHATGVDNDPQALTASANNAERNGVSGRLALWLPDDVPAGPFDMVVANILAGTLKALAPRLASAVRTGGLLAISGLMDGQADETAACYEPWFEDLAASSRDGWVLVEGRRNGEPLE